MTKIEQLKIQLSHAEFEAEQNRLDAERYRWLRNEHDRSDAPMARVSWKLHRIRNSNKWTNIEPGSMLDAEIDFAIKHGK